MEKAALFGAERIKMMDARMQQFARSFGLEQMGSPSRLPNTRKILAMTEAARDAGKLDALRDAAMKAYWLRSADLESADVLKALAREVGLPESAAEAYKDPALDARVTQNRREAMSLGVSGIPTFFFNGLRVVGCQPYEELAQAAEAAGARKR